MRIGQVELPPEGPLPWMITAAASPDDVGASPALGAVDDSAASVGFTAPVEAPGAPDSDAPGSVADPEGVPDDPADAPDDGFEVGFAAEPEGDDEGFGVAVGVLSAEGVGLGATLPGAGFHDFGDVKVMVLEK